MLNSISFKFGSNPDQSPLAFETPPSVTIFVGPNNSGKSRALNEIEQIFRRGENNGGVVIRDIEFKIISREEAQKEIISIQSPLRNEDRIGENQIIVERGVDRFIVNQGQLYDALTEPNALHFRDYFARCFASLKLLSLGGAARLGMLEPQERGDLKYPLRPFAKLLMDNPRREALRDLVYDATGFYFVLDAFEGGHICARFSLTEPPNERSLEDETAAYMREALSFSEVSDGVKAFTGILLQLHVGNPKVITIDEPEAFLHPSLAYRLGKEIAKGAVEEEKRVFAATHSPQFLMGAIASGAHVNVVRMTYQRGIGTARLLPAAELRELMQDPLLRSVGVLEGLFYDGVVVGEANADRAFYQEVNERLAAVGDRRAARHTLFLNADTKQSIPRIIAPLRKLGIPSAGVVDIDVLKDGGGEWTRHLSAAGIPEREHPAYATARESVLAAFKQTSKDFKREGGIYVLEGPDLEAARNLLDGLLRYGLFVVPRGEVETWLADLHVDRSKGKWLHSIFEVMGSDPKAAGYVRPSDGDVWDFVGGISGWIADPNRRGIPS